MANHKVHTIGLTNPTQGETWIKCYTVIYVSALVFEAALKVSLPLMASHFFLTGIRDVMAGFEAFDIAGVVAHTTIGGWVATIYGRGLLLSAREKVRTKRQDVGSDISRRILRY